MPAAWWSRTGQGLGRCWTTGPSNGMKTKTIFVVIALASLLGGAFSASLFIFSDREMPLWSFAAFAVLGYLAAFAALIVYLLPTLIAARRRSDWFWPAAVINVFHGWSLVGWVVALALAAQKNAHQLVPALPPHDEASSNGGTA